MRGNISGEERWETSVFQSSGLDEEQIRELALKYVVPYRKQLRARADWLVAQVMSVGLGVVEDPPPPLHAVIIGWSSQIEQWMQTQVDLCAEAELTLYNEPIE
ncbi:MAG: hypothetical protein JWL61_2306 [Gemmatimonadetes bacterium]|nr:hypothetical protein [Gemmatimonadota bacterium]